MMRPRKSEQTTTLLPTNIEMRAPQIVRAAEMLRRRRLQSVGKIDVGGVLGSDPGSEEGAEDEHYDQHHSHGRQRIMAGEAGERDGGGGHRFLSGPLVYTWKLARLPTWYSRRERRL